MYCEIREMTVEDWEQVRTIYVQGIRTGNSTFETDAPSWENWDLGHVGNCRLVACLEDKVVGWAALSPVSGRCVYSGVAEVSVYVSEDYSGKGIGQNLLSYLVRCSERNGFWTLQAGIFPENIASLSLHKKCGFREIGKRERLGRMKNGHWRDVVLLERRSTTTGMD